MRKIPQSYPLLPLCSKYRHYFTAVRAGGLRVGRSVGRAAKISHSSLIPTVSGETGNLKNPILFFSPLLIVSGIDMRWYQQLPGGETFWLSTEPICRVNRSHRGGQAHCVVTGSCSEAGVTRKVLSQHYPPVECRIRQA